MAKMNQYKDKALVLKATNYGEADKILTLFCQHEGKKQAIAKGARKLNSRKRGTCQIFVLGDFLLSRGRSLDMVAQCATVELFPEIREDLDNFAFANYFCELVYSFLPEGETNETVFLLLLEALYQLSAGSSRLLISQFELQLLGILGYRPVLNCCCGCGQKITANPVIISINQGGLVCQQCFALPEKNINTDLGTVETLKFLQSNSLQRLAVLKIGNNSRQAIAKITAAFVEFHLDKRLKSLDFLRNLPED